VALAPTTGIAAVLAGLLRLGFLASFISEPVLKGFIIGLALTTVVVGLGSLALVLGLRRLAPAVPGSLVAVLAGILAVWAFDLDRHGADIVGRIDSGLPTLGLPGVAAGDYLDLVPAAAGVMLVGFAEGLGAAKTYAARHHQEVDANRELLGLGAANLGAGLSSGMVVNGSLSKTTVNGAARAHSQVSGLVVAARPDFLAALAALAGVLVFDALPRTYRTVQDAVDALSGPGLA
jgi:sulfate permease, SulP family